MPGLFQGLEIGKRALLTHQFTLQTVGHNIANVNTPGFTRQRVNVISSLPEDTLVGTVGSGVRVADIRHIRDLFLGEQYRQENKQLGQWAYKEKIMTQIESLFKEPNDNSLSDLLDDFWAGWSDIITENDVASRNALVSRAEALTNSFHQLSSQLENLRSSIDRDLVNLVDMVNGYAEEIARINGLIQSQELGNIHANDLRDARDLLIDELSELVDVNTIEKPNGAVIVFIGAMAIVDGPDSMEIDTPTFNVNGKPEHRLVWKGSTVELKNLNGQLKGLLDARDEMIPRYLEELHTIAQTLISEVNALHVTGYGLPGAGGATGATGLNFFDSSFTDAFTIRLNREIVDDPSKIAAASTPDAEGDNTIAIAIHSLQSKKVLVNSSTSLSDYYNSLVGKLGVESNGAKSFTSNYELLVNQIDHSRQAVQGVSLDEEMANLVKFQHAYDAAARVITTMDEALTTVINGVGRVGL